MSMAFQVKTVPSRWIVNDGYRLDCGAYLSGVFETRELLQKFTTEPLHSITSGIFHAGRESRVWVDSADYGVPFLSNTDIHALDISRLPYMSKKQVRSKSNLILREGWSLITRSGATGRMAYSRSDMDGKACSEHVMRVVPNEMKVKPGYIYAFLSSRFGIPIIVSGTYGSIIQRIEPQHLVDLPVPRLGTVEQEAHDLVQQAAELRVEANSMVKEAAGQYLKAANIQDISPNYWLDNSGKGSFVTPVSKTSLRAMNYIPLNAQLAIMIKERSDKWLPLIDVVEESTLRSVPHFKRVDSEHEFGVELIGQSECFSSRPSGRWISRKHLPNDKLLFPPDGTIMIAAQVCAGETDLFGRAQFITGKFLNYAYSHHFLRVIGNESVMPRGALFAFIMSEISYRIRKGFQTGSMQQDFHLGMMKSMPIPIIDYDAAKEIDTFVKYAYQKRDRAIDCEDQARSLVERAIEDGGQ